MNVLSLFDGLSAGQIALNISGIKYDNYYASEIDKYAIQICIKNYPDTIQLGDVTKWRDWNIDFSKIDLLLAGFPCQAWSVAGKQKGDNDPRGALVHDLINIWNEIKKHNPDMKFLFENVRMKQEFINYINNLFGVSPIEINSALVSAQNRKRLYWTNIPGTKKGLFSNMIEQPEDRGIVLKDILNEIGYPDREKSLTVTSNYVFNPQIKDYTEKKIKQLININPFGCIQVGTADLKGNDQIKRIYSPEGKSPSLTTMQGGHQEPKISCGAFQGRGENNNQELELRKDNKTNTLTSVEKDNVLCFNREPYESDFKQNKTIHYKSIKHPTLCSQSGGKTQGIGIHNDNLNWRKLTPIECERLQTIPENYTEGVSNSQRYKMIGNSWTVDVICHILKGLNKNNKKS